MVAPSLEPSVVLPFVVCAALYAAGATSSWKRAGFGRGVKPSEAACFAGGMLTLLVALVWPLEGMGEELFSAHMAQHLALMNIAAPLLVLGAPLQTMIRPLPLGARRAAATLVRQPAWRSGWKWLSGLAIASVLQQVALWGWHTPGAIAAALASEGVHALMHTTLLAAALLYWTAVLHPRGQAWWGPLGSLLLTAKVTGLVCIVLLIKGGVYYTAYGNSAAAWGMSPADDEQLAWGLMMIVMGFSYLGAAAGIFAVGLASLERTHPSRRVGRPA